MHEQLVTRAEPILRRMLASENYDSISNFISLYDAFEKSSESLFTVYKNYVPPICTKKLTCVGLGLELLRQWQSLEKDIPGLMAATSLLSCEEGIGDMEDYMASEDKPVEVLLAEKEHVLVGLHICVDGRTGIMLADPGYHVSRIITVMADKAYPHTGWFTQTDDRSSRKEYNYMISPRNKDYIEWYERVTKPGANKNQSSLVYIGRPYLDSVNVTERRNLVYNFRSLLARDQKGHLTAGLYFPVDSQAKDAYFTLFYECGTVKLKSKYKFSILLEPGNIPKELAKELQICSDKMNYSDGVLLSILRKLAKVMANQSFIDQLLVINDQICRMCLLRKTLNEAQEKYADAESDGNDAKDP